jgi:hypothetical protein
MCASDGMSQVCFQVCDFWGGTGTCDTPGDLCEVTGSCGALTADPAAIGDACAAATTEGTVCAQSGKVALGICLNTGSANTCLKYCRASGTDCGSGETCYPFAAPLDMFGICF